MKGHSTTIKEGAFSSRRLLLGILILSVLFRVGAALYLGNTVEALPGTFDQVSYHRLALRLLDRQGFTFGEPWWPLTQAGAPTAHWSYLYTLYLALVYSLFGPYPLIARLIQAVGVGLMHPYLAYKLGQTTFDERVGLVSAGLTTVYAYFVYYTGALMTESFYIAGILGALYLTVRLARAKNGGSWQHGLGLGIILGLTVLLRQLFLLFIPFLLLWLWASCYKRGQRLPWAATVTVIAVLVMMILPFTVYNYGRFDRFVLLNTNAGYAFFWANHPIYGTHFEPILPPEMGTYQELVPQELRQLDEAALDQALLRRGLQFVRQEPRRYLLLSLSRIPAYFKFWPSADSSLVSNVARVASFGLFWPFMLYGLVRTLWRRNLRGFLLEPAFLLFLFALVYTSIHLLSWALIRYRLPVDAVLLVYAGAALTAILGRIGTGVLAAAPTRFAKRLSP